MTQFCCIFFFCPMPPPHLHHSDHSRAAHHAKSHAAKQTQAMSFLSWPAWQRVLAVLPLVLLLWLAVRWTYAG